MRSGPLGTNTTQPGAPESKLSRAQLALYFVYPPELDGLSFKVASGVELGRGPWENLAASRQATIPHSTVSRRHAKLSFGFGQAIMTDLDSTNGSRVDGQALSPAAHVSAGSVVRLGDTIAIADEMTPDTPWTVGALPGRSAELSRLRERVARAAAESASVLIEGETGTGKELLAAEVHGLSGRTGSYLKLNCAALSPQLIESQLFGHEKGAFTGATSAHPGLFVAAEGGTLFLDEVGELPLELQAKLLRVLQDGEVRPVGSVHTRKTNVRVVSATNRNLAQDVEEGRFRRDLYARLAVFELRLPPLRQRRRDLLRWIALLAENWARSRNTDASLELQPAVAERLLLHTWPDNLRGLDRFVQRVLTAGNTVVGLRALSDAMPELAEAAAAAATGSSAPPAAPDDPGQPAAATDRPIPPPVPTREEFLAVFEANGRNVRATSKHFGRDRKQIYRWARAWAPESEPDPS